MVSLWCNVLALEISVGLVMSQPTLGKANSSPEPPETVIRPRYSEPSGSLFTANYTIHELLKYVTLHNDCILVAVYLERGHERLTDAHNC